MNTSLSPEIFEVIEVPHYLPAVSIIMPFEPKMSSKNEINYSLKMAVKKVEQELEENFNGEMVGLVIQKLKAIIQNLNFSTHKKSVAIYVSPVFEKVLYLNIDVEEKIIVDESFEIRDLVYSKKELHRYLVLLLSDKESSMFLGNTDSFIRIVSNTAESATAYAKEVPERVSNYSDMSDRREIMMDKFLHRIDKGLNFILNAPHPPLFVLGTERIVGHFKSITKHAWAVTGYINGNYEEATPVQLKEILEPHIADWKKVKQKDLLNQLDEAHGAKKLAIGMQEVWRQAMHRKGRLLLVEKNYMYAAQHGIGDDIIYKASETYNKFSCIKDAVDDVIEKVLENGGDVEFVDTDILKDYDHIALIQYY